MNSWGSSHCIKRRMKFSLTRIGIGLAAMTLLLYLTIKLARTLGQAKFQPRLIDPSTIVLTETEIKSLDAEAKLYPMKSRGATIFVDKDGAIRIPPASIVNKMEFRDLEELYHRYLSNIQAPCKQQIHLGNIYDGGYDVCQDPKYAPPTDCLVYSFGILRDFTFDDGVRQSLGCEVHSFDPSNGMADHTHNPGVHFHSTGIGDRDEINADNWKMRTLRTIRKELGHTRRNIDILKIDIESSEWKALPDILATGQLVGVKQLLLELHSLVHGSWSIDRSHQGYRHYLTILRQLYDLGFRTYFYRLWIADCCRFVDEFGIERTGCHEVLMVKV